MRSLQTELYDMNRKIERINEYINTGLSRGASSYLRELEEALDELDDLLSFRYLDIPYNIIPEEALIDVFLTYNSFSEQNTIIPGPNVTIYPLVFPYSGARGPRKDIEQVFASDLGKKISRIFPFILGIEPVKIKPVSFKPAAILKGPTDLKGTGTLIGIIDTGIDYTNPVFIDGNGETRIEAIWDQTIGSSSPYGYGTVYDKQTINAALQSLEPFQIVPHQDEVGHGTALAGIAAGFGEYEGGIYEGVAPGAEIAVVKLKPASDAMQRLFHGKYNPLGFFGIRHSAGDAVSGQFSQ